MFTVQTSSSCFTLVRSVLIIVYASTETYKHFNFLQNLKNGNQLSKSQSKLPLFCIVAKQSAKMDLKYPITNATELGNIICHGIRPKGGGTDDNIFLDLAVKMQVKDGMDDSGIMENVDNSSDYGFNTLLCILYVISIPSYFTPAMPFK